MNKDELKRRVGPVTPGAPSGCNQSPARRE